MEKLLYYSSLNYHPDLLDKLKNYFDVITLKNPGEDKKEILSQIAVCFAPLGFPFGEKKLESCPNLKIVASNTTGTPHIDIDACKKRNIYVASLAGESKFLNSITPTAEHTFGLILALIRNTLPASESVLRGEWSRWAFGAPKMLSRMSLGIVGLGRIGKMVERYAYAFGMRVFYYDPYVTDEIYAKRMAGLDTLVSNSDVVSVHAPLNAETSDLFNEELFSKFKPGAYFINTARGGIVDSNALLRALENKILAGCALDVLEERFDAGDLTQLATHPLVQYAKTHPNIILTPHIAGSTQDAWFETQNHTVDLVLKHWELNN